MHWSIEVLCYWLDSNQSSLRYFRWQKLGSAILLTFGMEINTLIKLLADTLNTLSLCSETEKKFEWFIQTSCPFCKLKHVANHFFDFNCSHSHSFSINFCTIDSFYENTMWAFSARMNQKLSPSRLSSKLKLPYFNFDFINGMEPKLEASSWLFGRVNWKRKFKWIMAYNRCKISSDSFWNILGVSIFNSAKQ